MSKYLVYNFSGELDDISHLFPNERLGRIASALAEHGGEVTVLDRANFDDLEGFGPEYMKNLGELPFDATNELYASRLTSEAEHILAGGYDTVLLNLWHGTGFKFSIDLATALKEANPAMSIYGVGQKVDWFKEHILRLAGDGLDGLVTGLGYDAIVHLARHGNLVGCPNSVTTSADGIVVNQTQTIDVDQFPPAEYGPDTYTTIHGKVPVFSLTLSNQACPNQCVFCIRPENYGRHNIRRSMDSVLDELRRLRFEHNVRHIRIEDSTPPANALTELADALLNSDLKGELHLSAFSRIDTNRAEDFGRMREAGFEALFFGIESLDNGVLRQLRKTISYEDIRATLEAAHEAGIRNVGSLIFPVPGETRQTMAVTLERLREIRGSLDSLVAVPAGVYPHTEWGDHPERYGIVLEENYIEKFITYPIKYLLPLKYWPPVPFRYPVMDLDVETMDFSAVIGMCEEFLAVVRGELQIPPIADYYFLLADLVDTDPISLTRGLIGLMIGRDYQGIRELLTR